MVSTENIQLQSEMLMVSCLDGKVSFLLCSTVMRTCSLHRLAGLLVKASASGVEDPGFESACDGIFLGRVIPVTYELALQ